MEYEEKSETSFIGAIDINAELTKIAEKSYKRPLKCGDYACALLPNGRMTQWEFRGYEMGWICVYGMEQ